jgi:hypothetical protein
MGARVKKVGLDRLLRMYIYIYITREVAPEH